MHNGLQKKIAFEMQKCLRQKNDANSSCYINFFHRMRHVSEKSPSTFGLCILLGTKQNSYFRRVHCSTHHSAKCLNPLEYILTVITCLNIKTLHFAHLIYLYLYCDSHNKLRFSIKNSTAEEICFWNTTPCSLNGLHALK